MEKQITLLFEFKNHSYNTTHRFYLISENNSYEFKEIASNGFSHTKSFTNKKDAMNYINNEIDAHKRFLKIK
jgi:predicted DNA-binding WGR domain protein